MRRKKAPWGFDDLTEDGEWETPWDWKQALPKKESFYEKITVDNVIEAIQDHLANNFKDNIAKVVLNQTDFSDLVMDLRSKSSYFATNQQATGYGYLNQVVVVGKVVIGSPHIIPGRVLIIENS